MDTAITELIETIHRICEDKIKGSTPFNDIVDRQAEAIKIFKSKVENLPTPRVVTNEPVSFTDHSDALRNISELECCEAIKKSGFYLGMTCPKCKRPFRVPK
jgi:hypothetical protein